MVARHRRSGQTCITTSIEGDANRMGVGADAACPAGKSIVSDPRAGMERAVPIGWEQQGSDANNFSRKYVARDGFSSAYDLVDTAQLQFHPYGNDIVVN